MKNAKTLAVAVLLLAALVLACGLGIGFAGSVVPAAWLARMPLSELVREE